MKSFFQRTPGSLVYGTKDCKDKTLLMKESMIKDMARELRASIEELHQCGLLIQKIFAKVISR